MKTYDKKDVYCLTNAQDAKQFIGKKGYFLNYLDEDLSFWVDGTLTAVKDPLRCSAPFCKNGSEYALFLPANKVVDTGFRKRCRPYKHFLEFTRATGIVIGDEIELTDKDGPYTYSTIFTGHIISSCEDLLVFGCGIKASFKTLCNEYLWKDKKGNLVPFGVEE